jgi:hypothetical protein
VSFGLEPYQLPESVEAGLLSVAKEAYLLVFGELHGTQEVPRLIAALLPALRALNYQGLALEVPCSCRDELMNWAEGRTPSPPEFFARPTLDGRGNRQTLTLAQTAAAAGWRLLCFDNGPDQLMRVWADRDHFMAQNLAAQWTALCPETKIVAICGNLHARTVETLPLAARQAMDRQGERWWPSFANWAEQGDPGKIVRSVNVVFHAGEMFNMGVRSLQGRTPLGEPELGPAAESGHSLSLHLPRGTAATFLQPPYDWREP